MSNQQNVRPTFSSYIKEFEGLRGLLAAWVVLGHILLLSGFEYQDGWFGILFSPVLGVYVFMILSGFVITATLDRNPTSWIEFMKRRTFRIFPVYLFCLFIAILLWPMSQAVSQSNVMSQFGPENMSRIDDVSQNFGLYLLFDLTLLQGLLPQSIFPFASESFLPPTWSLTLEWMFYLIAPFAVWLFRVRPKLGIFAAWIFVFGMFQFSGFFHSWNKSFVVNNALYFLTGIASYYAWKRLPEQKDARLIKIAFWLFALTLFGLFHLPFKIWICMMVLILYPRFHHKKIRVLEGIRSLFCTKVTLFLGRTSYATYLFHWIAIEMVMFWIAQLFPETTNRYVLATVLIVTVYPMTYLVANWINKFIEVPMIEWSKHKSVLIRKASIQSA